MTVLVRYIDKESDWTCQDVTSVNEGRQLVSIIYGNQTILIPINRIKDIVIVK